MNDATKRILSIPKGVPIARHQPRPVVEVPANQEIPLIDGSGSSEKKLQQVWTAHVKVFDLSKEEDLEAYNVVWQKHTDQHAQVCQEKIEFNDGKYIALLRWAEFSYELPGYNS